MGFGQVKSFQGLFRRFLWWRKRGFYGNTQWRLTVTQKTTKSTRGWWWWWKGFPKRIWWPCADESHQSHILDSGAKVRRQSYSACFNAGQDRFSTWVDLIYGEQEQDVLSPDTQSFTAAIKLVYSEAKKTQLFQQNIRTRLASLYVQMTGEEHRCVCVCMQRQQYVFAHTHTHTQVRRRAGVQTHSCEGGCFFTQPWQCLWGCLTQKSLNFFLEFFSSKFESNCENLLAYAWEEEELGRRLLLLLFVLLLLVLLLLLEEGGRPQPLLLLRAERGFWIRSTACITLALNRKVENQKEILHSRPEERNWESIFWGVEESENVYLWECAVSVGLLVAVRVLACEQRSMSSKSEMVSEMVSAAG